MCNPSDGAYCYNLSRKDTSKQIGAEAGEPRIKGQPRLQSEPCLQNINKTKQERREKRSSEGEEKRGRERMRERGGERSTRLR